MKLTITDLNHEGDGVGRSDGIVTFVAGSLPGETVLVDGIQKKKRFQTAGLKEVVHASEHRIAPPCLYSGRCGGCSIQHYEYQAGLDWKKTRVEGLLVKAGVDAQVADTIGMTHPWAYRNNMQLKVGPAGIGFFERGSHKIVDIEHCPIQSETANRVLGMLRRMDLTGIREVLVRTHEKHAMVSLIGKNAFETPLQSLDVETVLSVWGKAEEKSPRKHRRGDRYLQIELGEICYGIHPATFFQVNTEMAEKLFEIALKRQTKAQNAVILDLYCGIGALTLLAAKTAKKAYGVEIQRTAVSMAKSIAERAGIENAKFFAAPSESATRRILQEKKPNTVFVDPPRAGLDKTVIQALTESRVPEVVYISCDPATLTRDLSLFQEGGWKVGELQPVDMFPWSTHVESVVLLSKVQK